MNCELCGKETEPYTVEIEGTELAVCQKCSSMGKILKKPKPAYAKKQKNTVRKIKKSEPSKEMTEVIVEDYSKKIRQAREKKGMTQKEFARKINEKESLLQKMETGNFKPSLALAKKLEKLLHIKIIEKVEEEEEETTQTKSKAGGMTIGDMIKL